MYRRIQLWDGLRAFFTSAVWPVSETLALAILSQVFLANTTEKTLMATMINRGLIVGIPAIALGRVRFEN